MRKQPCCATRVLDELLCPPANIAHDPNDYPDFYDPLYYPMLHPNIFMTIESVSSWLVTALPTALKPSQYN